MTISMVAEKVIAKIQYNVIHDKNHREHWSRVNIPKHNKSHIQETHRYAIMLNRKKLEAILPKSRVRHRYVLSLFLFNAVLMYHLEQKGEGN